MATQEYRIVSGADSELHDEPHVPGRRITVRDLQQRVEERGLAPAEVADRFDLEVGVVYEALADYHSNPETMRRVEERHERAVRAARQSSRVEPPG